MEEVSRPFIPQPVSPSSLAVSRDEMGVCRDCGGAGGVVGPDWVCPHRQLSYLAGGGGGVLKG